MLGLLEELHNRQEKKSSSEFNIKLIIEETANKQPTRKSRSVSETSEPEPPSMRREEERGGSESAGLAALLEMFPGCCRLEAVHCLAITRGDPEQAAQLILCRQEQGEDIKLSQAQVSKTEHTRQHSATTVWTIRFFGCCLLEVVVMYWLSAAAGPTSQARHRG